VDGSSVLVHTLAEANLVDEYSLLVFPIVLGSGKRVFPDGLYSGLKLVETKSFPTGVILLRYQPEGK
jgi:dihydrofolate reductase